MLKQINKSATVAWSPSSAYPSLLAGGTAAGTVDNAFDFTSTLEIYDVKKNDEILTPLGSVACPDRFNKLVWSPLNNAALPYGLLAGGMSNGTVTIWNPAKIIGSGEGALITTVERHTSPVQAVDFNSAQANLLASGAHEIYIWDLNNAANPTIYTPGASAVKSADPITCVAWNKKVAHILASAFGNGSCVIWDLKNKRPVLTFADPNRRQTRWRAVAWNPEEPTQIISASDDDACPVLSVWDLRNTYAPSRYLEGHQRGIWAISWSSFDNNLLLSCGRDNKTICWNASSGQILDEIEREIPTHWNFDVQWSPRLPAVLAASSLEGKVEILTLHDVNPKRTATSQDVFNPVPATKPLGPPPNWLKRPVGASFGWGGQLVAFFKSNRPTVHISKIVSEPLVIQRVEQLNNVLTSGEYKAFAEEKITNAPNEEEKATWSLIKIFIEKQNVRRELLAHLGFDAAQLSETIHQYISSLGGAEEPKAEPQVAQQAEETPQTDGENKADVSGLFGSEASSDVFDISANAADVSQAPKPAAPLIRNLMLFTGEATENIIARAVMIGDFEAAVDACMKAGRVADGLVLASVAPASTGLWEKVRDAYFQKQSAPFMKIVQSIAKNQLEELILQLHISQWKEILALLCTYAKKEEFSELCNRLAQQLEESGDVASANICYICASNIDKVIDSWAVKKKTITRPQEALQDLMEQVTVLFAIGQTNITEKIAEKYCQYAEILASQGQFVQAQHYLSILRNTNYSSDTINYLYDRVSRALQPVHAVAEAPTAAQQYAQQAGVSYAPQSKPAYAATTSTGYNQQYAQSAAPTSYSYSGYNQTPYSAPTNAPASTQPVSAAPTTPVGYSAAPTTPVGYTPAPTTPVGYSTPPTTSFAAPPTPSFTTPPAGTSIMTPQTPTQPTQPGYQRSEAERQTAKSFYTPLPPSTATTTVSHPPPASTSYTNVPSSPATPPVNAPASTAPPAMFNPSDLPAGTQPSIFTPSVPTPSTAPPAARGPVTPPSSFTPSAPPTAAAATIPAPAPEPPKAAPPAPLPEATGEAKTVIDNFTAILKRFSDPKKTEDINERLQSLFVKLRKNEIPADKVALLSQLGHALVSNDTQTANHVVPLISKVADPQITGREIIGIKNLKRLSETR